MRLSTGHGFGRAIDSHNHSVTKLIAPLRSRIVTDETTLSGQSAPDALLDLSPSAKLIAKTLEYEGESTQSDLAPSPRRPPRTDRDALDQLEGAEIVSSRISFADARKRIYTLELES